MSTDDAAKTPTTNPASDTASLRKKQILVVVLLVGLMVALLTQPEKDDEPRGGVSELQTTTVPVVRPVSLAGSTTPSEVTSDTASDVGVNLAEIHELTRFELNEIVHLELLAPELNPLANSPALKVPEVQAIYGSSDTRAALVGKDIVRRGQPLPGVGKVLSVSDEGIEVSR